MYFGYSVVMKATPDDELLARWREEMKSDSFPLETSPAFYERVQQLRELADFYERALIRHLHFERGLTWREVAEAVDANLGSRQASHAKWRRLVAPDRRPAGAPGRGGRKAPRLPDRG
jgi:hypothetical protein